ncbi:MORN repeat-containing protein 5 [Phlyctochytrium arcticum]|nr:MORN repeat-containing protein 5 [Phlyctochytrium arcticum]
MAFGGSPFTAEIVNDRIEGNGKYVFSDGNVYVGEFKDGQFHGTGTIHFKDGGKYEAVWDQGVATKGAYTFHDGLEYIADNWTYCTEADRRFFSERIKGFQPGDPQLTNNVNGAPNIPVNTFDVGDGYYDPKEEIVYDFAGVALRVPDDEEREWIIGHCRVGGHGKLEGGPSWARATAT